jgi:hypothetical protein
MHHQRPQCTNSQRNKIWKHPLPCRQVPAVRRCSAYGSRRGHRTWKKFELVKRQTLMYGSKQVCRACKRFKKYATGCRNLHGMCIWNCMTRLPCDAVTAAKSGNEARMISESGPCAPCACLLGQQLTGLMVPGAWMDVRDCQMHCQSGKAAVHAISFQCCKHRMRFEGQKLSTYLRIGAFALLCCSKSCKNVCTIVFGGTGGQFL